jgi:hypothetical protein
MNDPVPSRIGPSVLLPFLALLASVLIYRLGGVAALAEMAGLRRAPSTSSTIDYPPLAHRS